MVKSDSVPNIVTKVEVDTVEFNDYQRLQYTDSNSDYDSSSEFKIIYDSPFGRHSGDFSVGQEVKIYANDTNEQMFENTDLLSSRYSQVVYGNVLMGQTFTIGTTGLDVDFQLSKIKIRLRKIGNPGDMAMTVSSVADEGSGDLPVGDDLATSVIEETAVGTSTSSYTWVTFSFENDLVLSSNTMYSFLLEASDGTLDTDMYYFNYNNGTGDGIYSGGEAVSSEPPDNLWEANTGDDFFFELYGNVVEAQTNTITGVIERVEFDGKENTQRVKITGRDYMQRILDTTVSPIFYSDTEISTIVSAIMANNVSDVTTTNVNSTGINVSRIEFNHTTVFDALKKLAQLAGFYFYVDTDKDLHFEKRNNQSSGVVLDNTNISKSTFNQTREGMWNSVYVYGARALAGFEETLNAGSPVGGSVFTLIDKPRNTYVEVLGVPKQGDIYGLTVETISGPEYLVNFYDKQIIFVSGTELGYSSIPASGGSVLFRYDRDVPIVKAGRNKESISLYGKKELIINDTSINDPNTAEDLLKKQLENANPFKGVVCDLIGWHDITQGQTARVTLSDFGLDTEVGILSTQYVFDKNTVNNQKVISIRLDKKVTDIVDQIATIKSRVNSLEEQDRQSSDFLTRLEFFDVNYPVVGSYWEVKTRDIRASFVLGHPINGQLGSPEVAVNGSQVILGDETSAYTTLASGGFYN